MALASVRCPACNSLYHVDAGLLGKKGRCKQARCGTAFVLTETVARESEAEDATQTPPADGIPLVWHTGEVILDLYEVKQVHESGGMGLVYRVRHRGWNVELAVKCPRPDHIRTEAQKANFEREAETWVNLGLHPHTVSCYYVRRLGGLPRVFAEYVEGGSLKDWIDSGKLYEGGPNRVLDRILDVAIQFAWGLHHAHEQGLIHRDVKPGNVMMTPEGVAKVSDFGLAKAQTTPEEAAAAGSGRGVRVSVGGMTRAYCSPEQANREELTHKTDLWSWAVSVLEMFTGEVTWGSGTAAAESLTGYLEVGSGDGKIPPMPRDLAALLRRCFQHDPGMRPGDMQEVVTALRTVYEQAAQAPSRTTFANVWTLLKKAVSEQSAKVAYPRATPRAVELQADGLNNRALSLLDLGRSDEALRLLDEAYRLNPQHPEATYNGGLMRWRRGETSDDALLARLDLIGQAHPGDWVPLYMQACVQLERGTVEGCRQVLGRISPTDAAREEIRALKELAGQASAQPLQLLRSLKGHTKDVTSLSLSGDGRLALSGSEDQTAKLWDTSSGQCLQTFVGHSRPIGSVSLSADGQLALSGSSDQTVRLWETSSGRCLQTFVGHGEAVNSVCLSGDGRVTLSGSGESLRPEQTLKVWDTATGRCRHTLGGSDYVSSVGLSPDGRLALCDDEFGQLTVWDTVTGNRVGVWMAHQSITFFRGTERYVAGTFRSFHGTVASIQVTADGQRALTAGYDGTLKLWELPSGRCLRTLQGHTQRVNAAALSADGSVALSGAQDQTVRLWDVGTGQCLATVQEHSAVAAVGLSSDSKLAVSTSLFKEVKVWQVDRGSRPPAPFLLTRPVTSEEAVSTVTSFNRDLAEARAALGQQQWDAALQSLTRCRGYRGHERHPEAVWAWTELYGRLPRTTFRSGWLLRTLEGHARRVTMVGLGAVTPTTLCWSWDTTLRLWEVPTGRCLRAFEIGKAARIPLHSPTVCGQGRLALATAEPDVPMLWDLSEGKPLHSLKDHEHWVGAVALSSDGRMAVSADWGGNLKVWDAASGRCLQTIRCHEKGVEKQIDSVSLSGDARLALAGSHKAGALQLWELSTGQRLCSVEGDTLSFKSVSLDRDGRLALANHWHELKVWELPTGRLVQTLRGHTGDVKAVKLNATGRLAVSGSDDQTVKLWEVATGRCLHTFQGHTGSVHSVDISPDDRFLVSGSEDRTVKVWLLDWELATDSAAVSSSALRQP